MMGAQALPPDGPAKVLDDYFADALAGRWSWWLLDEPLRLVHAQAWIWTYRHQPPLAGIDRMTLAAALTAGEELDFCGYRQGQLEGLVGWFRSIEYSSVAWSTCPAPAIVDHEKVMAIFMHRGRKVGAQPFLVRHTRHGWRIASYADKLPTPGWPPTTPWRPAWATA